MCEEVGGVGKGGVFVLVNSVLGWAVLCRARLVLEDDDFVNAEDCYCPGNGAGKIGLLIVGLSALGTSVSSLA